MKNLEVIRNEIRQYIGDSAMTNVKELKDENLIFDMGLLDSMGLLFLIEFLNEKYGVEVNDEELNPKNFESINSIAAFIESKL